jgi:hypothetical protein
MGAFLAKLRSPERQAVGRPARAKIALLRQKGLSDSEASGGNAGKGAIAPSGSDGLSAGGDTCAPAIPICLYRPAVACF